MPNSSIDSMQFPHPIRHFVASAILACALFVHEAAWAQNDTPVIESLETIRTLTAEQRVARPRAKVTGIVISMLPDERLFCLHDGQVGVLVLNAPDHKLGIGNRLEIEGSCLPDVGYHLAAESVKPLGTAATLPKPIPDAFDRLQDPAAAFLWVEVEAVIRDMHKTEVGWHLQLNLDGRTFTGVVPRRGRSVTREFRHSRVRVRGIIAPLNLLGESSTYLGLWIDDWNRILLTESSTRTADIPALSISRVQEGNDGKLESRRIKLRGQAVQIAATGEISLHDASGTIGVIPNRIGIAQPNDHLEVLGYLERSPQGTLVSADRIRTYGLAGSSTTISNDWTNMRELIRSIADIRQLVETDLTDEAPIRITGVVTMVDTNEAAFFLNDETGSIRINSEKSVDQLKAGDQLTVTGNTAPGVFGPVVKLRAMNWLSHGTLARPTTVTGTGLLTGRHEAEWVTFQGVVRRMQRRGPHTWLTIAWSDRRFHVRVPNEIELPDPIVGARLEVFGIVQARVNESGQLNGVNLLVNDKTRLQIDTPAPAEPFALDRLDIGQLMRFQPDSSFTKQKRAVGTVTLVWPNRLFLQDATGAVEIRTHERHQAQPGDTVSAVGFTQLSELKPQIVDALVRVDEKGMPPAATELDAGQILFSDMHGKRVRLRGVLQSISDGSGEHSLALHSGTTVFEAVLPNSLGGESLRDLVPGSLVELTGVCAMRPSFEGHSASFNLLLNEAGDVRVIQQPSWWTPERSIMIVVSLALLILAVLGWVQRLRGHVKESRTTLAASLDASPVAVCVIARDGTRMLAANQVFQRQFSFTTAEVNTRSIEELGIWPSQKERDRVIQMFRDRNSVRGLETQMRSGAGNTLRILVSGESIKWERSRAILLAAQDVTERFELVNQLRESQKMEAVGQLAAGVAHDFNNILTIIQGNSEMMADSVKDNAELVELNDDLLSAARRASNLTRQLLAFSRKQLMRPQILDLNEVVKGSLRMIERLLGAPIQVTTRLHEKPTHIYADSGMLDQVLMNLAVNSRDALPEGGELEITTRVVHFASGGRRAGVEAETGPIVQWRIRDNGTGMRPETLEKMFEPFFTTKDVGQGTGLGLATVFGIVKQHRGWVESESEVGRGTTINIFFPLAETAEDVDADDEPAVPGLMGTETILAVEDEPQLLRMVERTFQKHGYTVHTAENGIAARELWAKHRDQINLFFTDIVLPRGVSGWDLADEFSLVEQNLPIVYTSGYSPEFDAKGSILERGVNYIPKPFNQRELLTIVRESLERNVG